MDQSKNGLLNIGLFRKATIFHVAQVFIVFGDFRKGEERKSVAAGQSRNTQIQGFLKMILVIILSSIDKSEMEYIRTLRESGISCYSTELVLAAALKQKIELPPYIIRENGKSY